MIFKLANTLITTEAFKDANDRHVSHAAEGLGQGIDAED